MVCVLATRLGFVCLRISCRLRSWNSLVLSVSDFLDCVLRHGPLRLSFSVLAPAPLLSLPRSRWVAGRPASMWLFFLAVVCELFFLVLAFAGAGPASLFPSLALGGGVFGGCGVVLLRGGVRVVLPLAGRCWYSVPFPLLPPARAGGRVRWRLCSSSSRCCVASSRWRCASPRRCGCSSSRCVFWVPVCPRPSSSPRSRWVVGAAGCHAGLRELALSALRGSLLFSLGFLVSSCQMRILFHSPYLLV